MKQFIFIQGIALRIILLFGVAILGTFLSDYLTYIDWFKDTVEVSYTSTYLMKEYPNLPPTTEKVVWSARHYWYVWMFGFLFVLQLVSLIWYIINKVNKDFIND